MSGWENQPDAWKWSPNPTQVHSPPSTPPVVLALKVLRDRRVSTDDQMRDMFLHPLAFPPDELDDGSNCTAFHARREALMLLAFRLQSDCSIKFGGSSRYAELVCAKMHRPFPGADLVTTFYLPPAPLSVIMQHIPRNNTSNKSCTYFHYAIDDPARPTTSTFIVGCYYTRDGVARLWRARLRIKASSYLS